MCMLMERKAHEFQSFQNPKHHVCVCRPWSPKKHKVLFFLSPHLTSPSIHTSYAMCQHRIHTYHPYLSTYIHMDMYTTNKQENVHTYIHIHTCYFVCMGIWYVKCVSRVVWEAMYEWVYNMWGYACITCQVGVGGQETVGVKATHIPLLSLSLCLSCFLSDRVDLLFCSSFLWTHACKNVVPPHPIGKTHY